MFCFYIHYRKKLWTIRSTTILNVLFYESIVANIKINKTMSINNWNSSINLYYIIFIIFYFFKYIRKAFIAHIDTVIKTLCSWLEEESILTNESSFLDVKKYPQGTQGLRTDSERHTSSCQFNSKPLYFTSFDGTGYHYGLNSYNTIYRPSKTSFTICLISLFNWTVVQMLNYSNNSEWTVNWLRIIY
jgi:hypothetical protein